MIDRDLVWNTGQDLQITSLSARLRDLLFPDGLPATLHVSELWKNDDPFGMMVVAHQWVLDGERMAFDTERNGMRLRISLEPLYDLSGTITGVGGRATPGVGDADVWQAETLQEVERICGFGTWRTDLKTGRTVWSAGMYEILGVLPHSGNADLRSFDHPEDEAAIGDAVRAGEISGTGYRCDHRVLRATARRDTCKSKRTLFTERTAWPGRTSGASSTFRIAKRPKFASRRLAHYDPVSNLPNRTLLEQRLHAALNRAAAEGTFCAVLFLDVDGFKRVNDTYGHAAGDELLAAIGTRLNHHVRSGDTVAHERRRVRDRARRADVSRRSAGSRAHDSEQFRDAVSSGQRGRLPRRR